jgi:hypothetical protein
VLVGYYDDADRQTCVKRMPLCYQRRPDNQDEGCQSKITQLCCIDDGETGVCSQTFSLWAAGIGDTPTHAVYHAPSTTVAVLTSSQAGRSSIRLLKHSNLKEVRVEGAT